MTMVGTLQQNRKGIPPEIKVLTRREILSSEIYWEENSELVLCTYVVSTSSGKKNVLLLTTTQPLLGNTMDDGKNKPAIYKLYDFTKGGTDIVDQRMGFYSSKVKSRRWSIVGFSYILDTARVNAGTLFALNQNKNPLQQDSFEFGMKIVYSLVKPFISQRNLLRVSPVVKKKVEMFIGVTDEIVRPDVAGPSRADKRARCDTCKRNLKKGETQQGVISF